VLIKASLLFVICNLSFAFLNTSEWLGNLSAYNFMLPGRERLPWSENPKEAYSLSLNNLDAMFASHAISGAKKTDDEYRLLIMGDSSTWGFLLPVEDTLTANINRANLVTADGKRVQAYNLGYPTISLTKDLLLLDFAIRYEPDMILWLVTLEAFPNDKQIFTPLVQNNPDEVGTLIDAYDLNLNPNDEGFFHASLWERTIVGQRRPLADLLRLQLYGVMWAATGIDQDIPEEYDLRQSDFEIDDSFYEFSPPTLSVESLAFDVLSAGVKRAGDIPILIVNEPIFISKGANSDIRYNIFYPRWAYNSYRHLLAEYSASNSWPYLDLWDVIPPNEFTNTAIHITPFGTAQLASYIEQAIVDLANGNFTSYNYNND
jgi:hypothetical protein